MGMPPSFQSSMVKGPPLISSTPPMEELVAAFIRTQRCIALRNTRAASATDEITTMLQEELAELQLLIEQAGSIDA